MHWRKGRFHLVWLYIFFFSPFYWLDITLRPLCLLSGRKSLTASDLEQTVGIQAEEAYGKPQQQTRPQPQVGMASGRLVDRQAVNQRGQTMSCRLGLKWQMCSESLTLLIPPLSLHLSPLCASLAQPPPVWIRRLKREPSLHLLISPGCPGWLHLMTSGSHYWKAIVFVITSHFPPPYGNPPVATATVKFVRVEQKCPCWLVENKSQPIWFFAHICLV